MHTHPHHRASDPFLKWPGSKRRLLPRLLPLLPLRGRLIEPFLGAGSVFLSSDYDRYLLGDANPDLAALWVSLKDRPRQTVEEAAKLFVNENLGETAFKRIRDEFNSCIEPFDRAVRLIYLNRFAFNGLYRVNRSGRFNVPYAHPKVLPRFPYEELEAASQKLHKCTVLSSDFEALLEDAGFGDAVYCDPPYLPSVEGDSFTAYTGAGFTLADHQRLVAASVRAVGRGATVLISNHNTAIARQLYAGWEQVELEVRRSIAAAGERRGMAAELVAILRPLGKS